MLRIARSDHAALTWKHFLGYCHQRSAPQCPAGPHNRDPCAGGQCPPPAGSPPSDDGALRLQYAMAIVRLVNGVADAAQKGRTAVSVAGLAAQAGLYIAA